MRNLKVSRSDINGRRFDVLIDTDTLTFGAVHKGRDFNGYSSIGDLVGAINKLVESDESLEWKHVILIYVNYPESIRLGNMNQTALRLEFEQGWWAKTENDAFLFAALGSLTPERDLRRHQSMRAAIEELPGYTNGKQMVEFDPEIWAALISLRSAIGEAQRAVADVLHLPSDGQRILTLARYLSDARPAIKN